MVMVVVSMEVKEGREREAREHFRKSIAYQKKAFGVESRVLQRVTPRAGENARRIVMTTFDSLAAWAEYQQKVERDPQWQALVEESFRGENKCFAHNTFSRAVYEVVE